MLKGQDSSDLALLFKNLDSKDWGAADQGDHQVREVLAHAGARPQNPLDGCADRRRLAVVGESLVDVL